MEFSTILVHICSVSAGTWYRVLLYTANVLFEIFVVSIVPRLGVVDASLAGDNVHVKSRFKG